MIPNDHHDVTLKTEVKMQKIQICHHMNMLQFKTKNEYFKT